MALIISDTEKLAIEYAREWRSHVQCVTTEISQQFYQDLMGSGIFNDLVKTAKCSKTPASSFGWANLIADICKTAHSQMVTIKDKCFTEENQNDQAA